VERWRWAEIRQGQIKDAQRRQALCAPTRKAQIAALKAKMSSNKLILDCSRQLADIERYIAEIGYDTEQHTLCAPLCVWAQSCCAINSYLQPSSNIPSYSSDRRILSSFCKPD